MRKTIGIAITILALTTGAYASDAVLCSGSQTQYYNNHDLTGSDGERGVTAVAEMVNAIIQTVKDPAPIYQVPAIIVPRSPSQNEQYAQAGYNEKPYAGYYGVNYLSSYLDATNGILVVKGNIQIILPNDGFTRTVEQKGDTIFIKNLDTKKVMTVKIK